MGICVGATCNGSKAYISESTRTHERLVKSINSCVASRISDPTFTWSSIQINKNTVSRKHCDKNNIGRSAVVLLGDFVDGAFVAEDCNVKTNETNRFIMFDGSKDHESLAYSGERYSIVVFCHTSHANLSESEKKELVELGFRLPVACREGASSITLAAEPGPVAGREGASPIAPAANPGSQHNRVLVEACCEQGSKLAKSTK